MTDFLADGPTDGPKIVLAHGSGAPMDSPFLSAMAMAGNPRSFASFAIALGSIAPSSIE